jgi:glyceraldehyde 3-phosphate dehydrogenase
MRILLNGVGRIGKAIVRIAQKSDLVDIVAINEQNTNIENIAYNINYDSTYGRFDDLFEHDTHTIYNSKSKIKILCEKSLEDIDFQQLQIDAIIDASGSKVDISMLKRLSVRAIFLTHPNNQADINIILGANEEALLQEHKIIATSSCNASALLPALTLLDKHYGIECGEITTIHPYLNHQKTTRWQLHRKYQPSNCLQF